MNSFVPELQNEHFAAVIEVLNGEPIAVERAMYNDDASGDVVGRRHQRDGDATCRRGRRGSAIGDRLIGYRLSAIGYRLSATG